MIGPGSNARGDVALRTRARVKLGGVLLSGLTSALLAGAGCGGSTNLTTDEVTVCSVEACLAPRPAGASPICGDGSIAGPTCIRHMDGTCGWAILTCPIERGPTAGRGGPGGIMATGGMGGSIGTGGRVGTGGLGGTGGRGTPTGGAIGTGGYIPTGGVIGTGGYIPTGGMYGTGGYIPTGGVIGTGGMYGTGGYIPTGGVIGTGGGFGTGGTFGSFAWTGGGSSYSALGYYEENLALSGTSFIITIAADSGPFTGGPACMVVGQFPTVPPPIGTYPMGDYDGARVDGTFVGLCSTFYGAPEFASHSISGAVVLSQSRAGLVEGSFTMHGHASQGGGTGGIPGGQDSMTTFSGAFSVGCRDNRPLTDPACAARSITK